MSSSVIPEVNEAGKSVDIAAETGTIVEKAVEPSEVGVNELHHITHIEHGKQCSRAVLVARFDP